MQYLNMTKNQIAILESKIFDYFESISVFVSGVEIHFDKYYTAEFSFDRIDNKPGTGAIDFKCYPVNDIIEDFKILNHRGNF